MTCRAFRRTDTDEWLDVVFTGEDMPDPAGQADDLAAALGIDPALLEHVDAEADPRQGDLLPLPAGDPPEPSQQEQINAELVDAVSVLTDLVFSLMEG